MLYLSTRNKTDSFTAFRAMHNDTTPDGGLYVPFRVSTFTAEELAELKGMTFGGAVAKILNLFFSQQLSDWDVDFCIGKTPVKMESTGHKAVVAELWHNPEGKYEITRNTLYSRLYSTSELPSDWAKIAIDIAILFGIYTQLPDESVFDIAVCENEAGIISAAWYARNMGLPVGYILITCNGSTPIWNLVRDGQINTVALKRQETSQTNLFERIIFDTYGFETAQQYIAAYTRNESYVIEEEFHVNLTDRLQTVVVGLDRAENVIQSTLRTNGYFLSNDAAGALGGLHDYRSQGGESRLTLLLSGVKPVN